MLGIEEADTGWRKSYLIRPAVRPEGVTHVLIGLKTPGSEDVSKLWNTALPVDSMPLDSMARRTQQPAGSTARRDTTRTTTPTTTTGTL